MEIAQNLYKKRCVRFDDESHAHYLTFSCNHRLPLFQDENICKLLLNSVEISRKKHVFDLWAYVIMPEHVHLLIWPRKNIYSISQILFSIKKGSGYKALALLREK